MLHQLLGSDFLLMHKLHPLWYPPAAFCSTCRLFKLRSSHCNQPDLERFEIIDRVLFRRIGQAMSINLMLYAAIKLATDGREAPASPSRCLWHLLVPV
jgi:hypothetical protein